MRKHILVRLGEEIQKKNSWGKNELERLLMKLMAEAIDDYEAMKAQVDNMKPSTFDEHQARQGAHQFSVFPKEKL